MRVNHIMVCFTFGLTRFKLSGVGQGHALTYPPEGLQQKLGELNIRRTVSAPTEQGKEQGGGKE